MQTVSFFFLLVFICLYNYLLPHLTVFQQPYFKYKKKGVVRNNSVSAQSNVKHNKKKREKETLSFSLFITYLSFPLDIKACLVQKKKNLSKNLLF